MITKILKPSSVSTEAIQKALTTPPNFKYPASIRSELATTSRHWFFSQVKLSAFIFIMSIVAIPVGLMADKSFWILGGIIAAILSPLFVIAGAYQILMPSNQSNPEKTAKTFYSDVLCENEPNYSRPFRLLAPLALDQAACTSVSVFVDTWQLKATAMTEAVKRDSNRGQLCDVRQNPPRYMDSRAVAIG